MCLMGGDLSVIRAETVCPGLPFNIDMFCSSRYLHLQNCKLSKL